MVQTFVLNKALKLENKYIASISKKLKNPSVKYSLPYRKLYSSKFKNFYQP